MTTSKLSYQERFELARNLRRFVNKHPEIEDITGYSQGLYLKVLDEFIQKGMPTDADAQNRLFELIREAF